MIYLIGMTAGFLNGFFAGGAGHILVFYLVFIKKINSHVGRSVSLAVLCLTSIYSIYGLKKVVELDMKTIITLVIVSCIGGLIGSKVMHKINPKILNLVSGIVIVSLSIYGLCR